MLIRVAGSLVLTACLLIGGVQAASAQEKGSKPSSQQQQRRSQDMEFDFVESNEAIWLTKGLNDTLFYPGTSFNSVRYERDQARTDGKLDLYKPSEIVEVSVQRKPAVTQELRLNGKVVKVNP